MTRHLAAVVLAVQLAACGSNDPPGPGALAGNWAVTATFCGNRTGPATVLQQISGGRTYKWRSADGYSWAISNSDGTCTITYPYNFDYPATGQFRYTGNGRVTCAPSASACATLSAALNGRSVCADSVGDQGTYGFTDVPNAVGGTVTVTVMTGAGNICTSEGLPDPFRLVLTRE